MQLCWPTTTEHFQSFFLFFYIYIIFNMIPKHYWTYYSLLNLYFNYNYLNPVFESL